MCAFPSPGSPTGFRPTVSIWLISFHIYLLGILRLCSSPYRQAMPFVIETPSQVRLKTGLERRLLEIENALVVFARRKVFVEI